MEGFLNINSPTSAQEDKKEKTLRSLFDLIHPLMIRSLKKGAPEDLEVCVGLCREALKLQPRPHPMRYYTLGTLARALYASFIKRDSGLGPHGKAQHLQELKESISCFREAMKLLPASKPFRILIGGALAGALLQMSRYGAAENVDESIELSYKVLRLQPLAPPERSSALLTLADALDRRFKWKNNDLDIKTSIVLRRELLNSPPFEGFDDRSGPLLKLAGSLWLCFKKMGELQDLEEFISVNQEAVNLLRVNPRPRASLQEVLNSLAVALQTRFELKGATTDLNKSISLLQEAVTLQPYHNRTVVNHLALAFLHRFKHRGVFQDLEECIRICRKALDVPDHQPLDRSGIQNTLAEALCDRFKHKRLIQDIEECISLHRTILNVIPTTPGPARSGSLNNLANALMERFTTEPSMDDLDEIISLLHEALRLPPQSYPRRSWALNTLANALAQRSRIKGVSKDLDEGIQLHLEALDLRPVPHPYRVNSLNNLACQLSARFERDGIKEDLEKALRLFREAVQYKTGSVVDRIYFAKTWVSSAEMHSPSSVIDAYNCVLELLPQLASLDLTLDQRQDLIKHSKELVGGAVKCAVDAKRFDLAVLFLSTSRSIFWTQALQLRTPAYALSATNPRLATKFIAVSQQLEKGSYTGYDSVFSPESRAELKRYTDSSVDLHSLVAEHRQICEEIREIPGYERFLLPPLFSSLQAAAENGPIVMLTACEDTCYALIMTDKLTDTDVTHIPLPEISRNVLLAFRVFMNMLLQSSSIPQDSIDTIRGLLARDMIYHNQLPSSGQDSFHLALKGLWLFIARPVIRTLGFEKTNSLKRLWWCPTGPFADLPIHAAGIYSDSDKHEPVDCVFQYVVSSYCTSPQDLLHAAPNVKPDFTVTAIIEPEVPGATPLPATKEELKELIKHTPDQQRLKTHIGLRGSPTKIGNLISDIQQSSFVHFGCHATHSTQNPLESYLLLSGGKLTMSKIIQECQIPEGALAYLSACDTAKGDEARPDESMNLVATMMFAGFRSVVGTILPIFDEDAPIVTNVFYRHLFRNGKTAPPNVTDAAYALHLATEELRDRGQPFQSWVPYVHYGI